jgi:hypothetical protein
MSTIFEIQNMVAEFESKAEAIRKNADFSQAGKEKALKALNVEKKAAFSSVIPSLRKQAVRAAIKADDLRGASAALSQIEKESWDYGRLAYESQAIRAALVLAGTDAYKVSEIWEQVKATNDNYVIRAAYDTIPLSIPNDESSIYAPVWDELKADLANGRGLLNSPKRAEFEKERQTYLKELTELSQAAEVVSIELGHMNGGANLNNFPNPNVMPIVFSGISQEEGQLKVDFGNRLHEKEDETVARLESEYGAWVKQQSDIFKAFGQSYDPIEDGI